MDLSLRSLDAADVPAIDALLRANRPVFSDVECETAIHMIREGLARPDEDDAYQFLVADLARTVVGYACFGHVPLTRGAFDLYWIAVHPDVHARGIGRQLLLRCQTTIVAQSGRLILAETSGRPDYDGTRRFYEKMQYRQTACIKDFFGQGDDKVVYVKYL